VSLCGCGGHLTVIRGSGGDTGICDACGKILPFHCSCGSCPECVRRGNQQMAKDFVFGQNGNDQNSWGQLGHAWAQNGTNLGQNQAGQRGLTGQALPAEDRATLVKALEKEVGGAIRVHLPDRQRANALADKCQTLEDENRRLKAEIYELQRGSR
jgi:hypothetical protein